MPKKKPFFKREENRRAIFISLWVAFILLLLEMLGIAVKQTLFGFSLMTNFQIPEYSMEMLSRLAMVIAIALVITKKFKYLEGE